MLIKKIGLPASDKMKFSVVADWTEEDSNLRAY